MISICQVISLISPLQWLPVHCQDATCCDCNICLCHATVHSAVTFTAPESNSEVNLHFIIFANLAARVTTAVIWHENAHMSPSPWRLQPVYRSRWPLVSTCYVILMRQDTELTRRPGNWLTSAFVCSLRFRGGEWMCSWQHVLTQIILKEEV